MTKLWIAATLAAILLAACNAKAYLPFNLEDADNMYADNMYRSADVMEDGNVEQVDKTPDIQDTYNPHYPDNALDSTPDANIAEFTDTGAVQYRYHCLRDFYILAFTSGRKYAGADKGHKVQVRAAGQTREIALPNRPGDDYRKNKGDLWKLTFDRNFKFTGCVTVKNIEYIRIEEGSNDGWNIDSIVTYVRATGQSHFTELTQNFNVYRWIDGNGAASHKHFTLTNVA